MLEAVWALGDGTVRELIEDQTLGVAYTMAMTTLDHLFLKHLLSREVEGQVLVTEHDIQQLAALQVVIEKKRRQLALKTIQEILPRAIGPARLV